MTSELIQLQSSKFSVSIFKMAKLVLWATLLILISVTSSSSLTSRASGRCPDSWMVFGKSCYKIILESQTWNEAQAMCKTLQSSLVNIGSREEDEFLVRLAKKNGVTAWIGLTDVVQEGNFVWNDTQKPPTYTHWRNGEPNNSNGGTEDCAALHYVFGYLWNDVPCERTYAAICEKYVYTGQ